MNKVWMERDRRTGVQNPGQSWTAFARESLLFRQVHFFSPEVANPLITHLCIFTMPGIVLGVADMMQPSDK